MRIIKRFSFVILAAIIFLSTPNILFAQPIDPCTDPADPCPIDSNLIVLFAAVAFIAAKKAYDFKKTAV